MTKYKSAFLLASLFFVAWAATSDVKTEVYVWLWKAKIEGPNFLLGTGMVAPLTLWLALPLILWLQRDQIRRTLAILGAAGSLLFCVESAQIIVWSALSFWRFLKFGSGFCKGEHPSRFVEPHHPGRCRVDFERAVFVAVRSRGQSEAATAAGQLARLEKVGLSTSPRRSLWRLNSRQ